MSRLWVAACVLLSLGCEPRPVGWTDVPGVRRHCESGACNPRLGNLAAARELLTSTTCGLNSTEFFCSYSRRGCEESPECEKCSSVQGHRHSHPPTAMTDSSFRFPNTWWQSAQGRHRETIQLDLETHFYFTHLIMIFKSPRPAAMVLERSQDFGSTWKPYKYFATNCTDTFGLPDDLNQDGAICTSRYSDPFPCTRGEVIFRALSPPHSIDDPYSVQAQDLLKVTNIRVGLIKRQLCPCPGRAASLKPRRFAHYGVYDFIVKGSCFCNGHAEQCEPAEGFRPARGGALNVVHGKCICKHHTVGEHCERCAPLYNDQPWRPADGKSGAANQCRKCKCNDHADSCHFDLSAWLASGNRSGGVCDNCEHNTEGQHCQRCQPGFYRNLRVPLSAPGACLACSCHPVGSATLPSRPCHPGTGDCLCKPGVAGPRCDRCMLGYWGLGEYGCRPCDCARSCDPYTGDCTSSPADIGWNHGFEGTGLIQGLSSALTGSEHTWNWEDEQGFSALRHSGKCECRNQVLRNPKVFCNMMYTFVLKVRILSAHDKGSHAEVNVKVKKVLKLTKLKIQRGKRVLYPESWTDRGCTCPLLNPGTEYLVAGHEDVHTGRLIVNMKSFVQAWKPDLGRRVVHILRAEC
ncbi:netrin-4 isoform X1 [Heptranchias perlo]|uniref:netrin-4 isoform X1 n=1 Tax=Heptranchias perlo TaxID=212740 RepID=UPI00355A390D